MLIIFRLQRMHVTRLPPLPLGCKTLFDLGAQVAFLDDVGVEPCAFLHVTFSPTTKPEKSSAEKATAARVFQRFTKLVEEGLFTQTKPICELPEGIVTVPALPLPRTKVNAPKYRLSRMGCSV
jgi:hypothetical protein